MIGCSWRNHCLRLSLKWQTASVARLTGLGWLKLIAEIASPSCGGSYRVWLSSLLFIRYSSLHLMWRSPSPLNTSPSSSKAALLGSVRTTPGVDGRWAPAECWVLRAWACLDQGLNFPLKMRKRFMALSLESVSCSLKLLSWWLLLSLGRDYFISSCSFLSLLPLFLTPR